MRERTTGQLGVILRLGPEVSLVRWDDGRERFVGNKFLQLEQAQ